MEGVIFLRRALERTKDADNKGSIEYAIGVLESDAPIQEKFDVALGPELFHPIGVNKRKGRNNTLVAGPDDPGSPYAIGAKEGGHFAVHPELGTEQDVRDLCATAHKHGMDVALDIALNASADHPWLTEHPE